MAEPMNEQELALLNKPLSKMSAQERALAFQVLDKLDAITRGNNAKFVPSFSLSAPMVISDYVEGGQIKSMVDGKIYDSKSRYYESIKQSGMVIIGNEKQKQSTEVNYITGRDVKNAIEQLRAR